MRRQEAFLASEIIYISGWRLERGTTVLFWERPLWYLLAIAGDTGPVHHGSVAGAIRSGFRVCFLGAFR